MTDPSTIYPNHLIEPKKKENTKTATSQQQNTKNTKSIQIIKYERNVFLL